MKRQELKKIRLIQDVLEGMPEGLPWAGAMIDTKGGKVLWSEWQGPSPEQKKWLEEHKAKTE